MSLHRKTPLRAKRGLTRHAVLAPVSAKRRAAAGSRPVRPFKASRCTGPSDEVRAIVWKRCKGRCEFPGCGQPAQDPQHRYERGNGGTGPKGAAWINDPVNILGSCRHHNDWVSNQQPHEAWLMGWRLKKSELPHQTPVMTCHDPEPVWLDNEGGWVRFEERAA